MPTKCSVTPDQWDHAADLFELGLLDGKQLGAKLKVSPQTVMREMRRRGAKKGSRVHQTVANLEAFIDSKQRREAVIRAQLEHTKAERRAAVAAALESMIAAMQEADRRGDLSLANHIIERTAAALGVPIKKRLPSR